MDFLRRNERKIYDSGAKMRVRIPCGTAQTNGLFGGVIQTEHIDNNHDDYNDLSTSLATLPTLPRNGSPYPTRPTISGPMSANNLVNLLLLYFMISDTFHIPIWWHRVVNGQIVCCWRNSLHCNETSYVWHSKIEKGAPPDPRLNVIDALEIGLSSNEWAYFRQN